mmetsp:Transcript_98593/g.260474  ORF Transcript_98593/g.260474 Transcript_98593/m.260474 type:complete len:290 (-) Transcript_98593:206-1075(-)
MRGAHSPRVPVLGARAPHQPVAPAEATALPRAPAPHGPPATTAVDDARVEGHVLLRVQQELQLGARLGHPRIRGAQGGEHAPDHGPRRGRPRGLVQLLREGRLREQRAWRRLAAPVGHVAQGRGERGDQPRHVAARSLLVPRQGGRERFLLAPRGVEAQHLALLARELACPRVRQELRVRHQPGDAGGVLPHGLLRLQLPRMPLVQLRDRGRQLLRQLWRRLRPLLLRALQQHPQQPEPRPEAEGGVGAVAQQPLVQRSNPLGALAAPLEVLRGRQQRGRGGLAAGLRL